MVQLSSFGASDALDDVRRSVATCSRLDGFVEDTTVEPDYKLCLLFLLRNAENTDLGERERVHAENIYEDCVQESDIQYDQFFRSHQNHEKSYVVDSKNNDEITFVKYEEESKQKEKCEPKHRRQVGSEIGLNHEESSGFLGLRNEVAPMDEHVFDKQVQSCYRSSKLSSRKCKTVVKKVSAKEKENEQSNEKRRKFLESQLGKNDANMKGTLQTKRKHLYRKTDPVNSSATKYHLNCADEPKHDNKAKEILGQTKLMKDIHEKNLAGKDHMTEGMTVFGTYIDRLNKECGLKNTHARYHHDNADQYQSGMKCMVQIQRDARKVSKGKDKVKVKNEDIKNYEVGEDIELLYHKPCVSSNQNKHTHREHVERFQPNHQNNVMFKKENKLLVDEFLNQNNTLSNVKTINGSSSSYRENQAAGEHDSVMQIINSVSDFSAGNFVMSKKIHESMWDQERIQMGSSRVQHEFRRQVLDVLKKPYDKQEYKMLREAVKVGLYLKYHPDLAKKIVKHRYKKGKCLAILRGFFFWLQNLTREGSFKPWKDGECLGVDPLLSVKP